MVIWPEYPSIDGQDIVILDGEKIKLYKLDGRKRFEVGGGGGEDGKLDSPQGVFITEENVYVADTGDDRIQIFSRDGIYLNKIINPKDSDVIYFNEPMQIVSFGAQVDGRVGLAEPEVNTVNSPLRHSLI